MEHLGATTQPLQRRLGRGLYARLVLTALVLYVVLSASQILFVTFIFNSLQDRAKVRILSENIEEVERYVSTYEGEDVPLPVLQQRLASRFRGLSDIGIFLIGVDGAVTADLSVSGTPLPAAKLEAVFPRGRALSRIRRFLSGERTFLRPLRLPNPQNPWRYVPFAAMERRVNGSSGGYLVITPGAGFLNVLGSMNMDAAGVTAGVVTVLLSAWGAILLGWLVFRRTASRLAAISTAIQEIARGRLEHRIPEEDRHDELESLAKSVSSMGQALARRDSERKLILSSVSHDLNMPIAVITSSAEQLLAARELEKPTEPFLEQVGATMRVIQKNSRAATGLLTELLELAVLDAKAEHSRRSVVNIVDLLDECVLSLRSKAREAGVELALEHPGSSSGQEIPLLVSADAASLERVVANLIGNAIRHTPSGGRVVASVKEGDVPGSPQGIRVSVRDTGEGISPDELERIFSPFEQGGREGKRGVGLAGLGLTICREILSRHDTVLEVVSAPGEGACFSFVLPLISREVSCSDR